MRNYLLKTRPNESKSINVAQMLKFVNIWMEETCVWFAFWAIRYMSSRNTVWRLINCSGTAESDFERLFAKAKHIMVLTMIVIEAVVWHKSCQSMIKIRTTSFIEWNHYCTCGYLELAENVFKKYPLHPAKRDLRKVSPELDPRILLNIKKNRGRQSSA